MKKRFVSLFIMLLFAFSVATVGYAAEIPNAKLKTESPSLISSQTKSIDGQDMVTKQYNDHGKIVTVISGNVSDKKAALKQLDSSGQFSIQPQPDTEFTDYTFTNSGTSSENSDVQVDQSVVFRAGDVYNSDYQETVSNGYTKGWWYGSSPVNADQIVLRQQYTMNAAVTGFSVGWPASISISGSMGSQTGTWVSAPFTNCWSCSAPHDHVVVHSSFGVGMNVDVEDGADVYLNGHCYKARSSISKSWTDLYYL